MKNENELKIDELLEKVLIKLNNFKPDKKEIMEKVQKLI